MNVRHLRVGDYVRDPNNDNYSLRVGLQELEYANIFEGVPLYDKFFLHNDFKADTSTGEPVYFREGGEIFVTARKREEGRWEIEVRNRGFHFTGKIINVHHFQHILSDCLVFWKIRL